MKKRYAMGWSLSMGTVVLAVACSPDSPTMPERDSGAFLEPGMALDLIPPGQSLPFVPVATSAACVAGGKGQQVVLPPGYVYTVVASEGPGFVDLADMNTVNEGGPQKGRFLYRTHEIAPNAGVSVTDLQTGTTRMLAQRADWERFDGITWTPWNTILAAEEATVAALPDPNVPQATGGLVYEINPETGAAVARPAVGSRSHEGLRFDKQGNLYGISETGPGYIYKFVPDRKNDLSSGQLYALKITQDLGDRTGNGVWAALDRNAVQVNSVAEAAAKGALQRGANGCLSQSQQQDAVREHSAPRWRRGGSFGRYPAARRCELQRRGSQLVIPRRTTGTGAPPDVRRPRSILHSCYASPT